MTTKKTLVATDSPAVKAQVVGGSVTLDPAHAAPMIPHVGVQVRYLEGYQRDAWGPLAYAKADDAGFDLRAAFLKGEHLDMSNGGKKPVVEMSNGDFRLILRPGEIVAVPVGIAVAVPPGWQLEVRPRSGLALKQGVAVVNSPGTVDAGYRGPVKAILQNLGQDVFVINPGDRIAQGVLMPAPRAVFIEVEELDETERGTGGFGSSGTK